VSTELLLLCGVTGNNGNVFVPYREQSSSSTVVKSTMSSTTVVSEKTVTRTTEDGIVTETTTSIQQVNGSEAEVAEDGAPAAVQ